MVTIPNFERFRQGDFIQYMNNLLDIITVERATQFGLSPQHTALQNAMNELNSAWQPQTGSEFTPEIQDLDRQRDSCFTGLKLTVDNWAMNHYNPAWRNAAYIVSDNIASHGEKITVMRYQQQTATLKAIIKDLGGMLAAHINTLGLLPWVKELNRINNAFDKKYVERVQAISGYDPGVIVTLISATTAVYRQMKTMFEARFAVAVADDSGTTDFQQAENEWSSLSRQYNDAVNRYTGDAATEVQQATGSEPAS